MGKSAHELVLEAVEDRFYEKGQFSNITDIVDWTGMSKSKVRSILDDLAGTGLTKVYERDGVPTVYITKQMDNSLTSHVGEPDWIEDFEFEGKRSLLDEIEQANEKISTYQQLERLLFGGGTPLENSVVLALTELGFDPETTSSDEDIRIEHEDHNWIAEVKGRSGPIKKEHVTQLGGWLDKKVGEGMAVENMTGLLIGNPEKNTKPDERGEELTPHAKEFLKLRDSKYVSTPEIFEIIKILKEGEKDETQARQEFLRLIQ